MAAAESQQCHSTTNRTSPAGVSAAQKPLQSPILQEQVATQTSWAPATGRLAEDPVVVQLGWAAIRRWYFDPRQPPRHRHQTVHLGPGQDLALPGLDCGAGGPTGTLPGREPQGMGRAGPRA